MKYFFVFCALMVPAQTMACEPFSPSAPKRQITGNSKFIIAAPQNGKLALIVCNGANNPPNHKIKHVLGGSPGLVTEILPGECLQTTSLASLEIIGATSNAKTQISFCVIPLKID